MKKILVPVDGSAFAEFAIDAAFGIARKTGAEVRLAMVAERQHLTEAVSWEVYMGGHQGYLDDLLARLEGSRPEGTDLTSSLIEGDVVPTLLEEASDWGADLLVMSTHGHGGLSRAWLGSVADALVHASEIPLLLVRPPETEVSPRSQWVPTRIAVTLDGSTFAEAALGPALELATGVDADIALVHVVSYPAQVSSYLPDTVLDNTDFIITAETDARGYLAPITERLEPVVGPVETRVMVSAQPANGVLDAVQELDIDLIVCATHARRGVARWLLGSVADKIVRGGSTPVLIVPNRN